MRLLPAVIIAVALLLVPVLWFTLPRVMGQGGQDAPPGMAIDSGARIDIEMLSQQVEGLRTEVATLTTRLHRARKRVAEQLDPVTA